MKTQSSSNKREIEAFLLCKCVNVEYVDDGPRYVVATGDNRDGQRGQLIATVGLKHAGGYVVVLQLDNGKLDSFNPMGLFPERVERPLVATVVPTS